MAEGTGLLSNLFHLKSAINAALVSDFFLDLERVSPSPIGSVDSRAPKPIKEDFQLAGSFR